MRAFARGAVVSLTTGGNPAMTIQRLSAFFVICITLYIFTVPAPPRVKLFWALVSLAVSMASFHHANNNEE